MCSCILMWQYSEKFKLWTVISIYVRIKVGPINILDPHCHCILSIIIPRFLRTGLNDTVAETQVFPLWCLTSSGQTKYTQKIDYYSWDDQRRSHSPPKGRAQPM